MYGILTGRTLTTYTKLTTLKAFGKQLVKLALKEEGKEFTTANIIEYLKEWADVLNENEDGGNENHTAENCTHIVADNLVYSNCHHYNQREPLNSKEKEELYKSIASFLDSKIEGAL
jgi:hypothetical protein